MLKIYQTASCPFCMMVVREAHNMGLKEGQDYQLINAARGTPGRQELLQIGGQNQVPFLTDGETAMYESRDIIAYMRNKFATV
ncbi:MAG: glutathione S-transferase N-terminal domain-containing protein [bacterium]|nr:glutathione S-transferase N-terminal domain-containing protein [bacterium]